MSEWRSESCAILDERLLGTYKNHNIRKIHTNKNFGNSILGGIHQNLIKDYYLGELLELKCIEIL